MIRPEIHRLGFVLLLMVSSCAHLSERKTETVLSEELKSELIAMQEAIMPSRPGPPLEVQIASIRKFMTPQAVVIVDGATYSRDEFVEILLSRRGQVSRSDLHDRKFISAGETVFIDGFLDRVTTFKGKKSELRNAYFCDVFSRAEGQWTLLATLLITNPTSPARSAKNPK